MLRRLLGVAGGLLAGVFVVALVEMLSARFYPLPADLDWRDPQALRQFLETLPTGAFLSVLAAHALGAATAGLVCGLVVRERWLPGPLILGGCFLLAGLVSLWLIPHPAWFALCDTLVYVPAALAGHRLAAALPRR